MASGCGRTRKGNDLQTVLNHFPPHEVCAYPANSSIKQLQYLGGGFWQLIAADDLNSGFNCGSVNNIVQLYGGEAEFVNVEFSAVGTESGVSMISIDYTTSGSKPVPNETTYRTVYARFADEIVRQSLGESMPELAMRKISNLNSYSTKGGGEAETFDTAVGFITVSRSRSPENTTIEVQVRIYPDKRLKLE